MDARWKQRAGRGIILLGVVTLSLSCRRNVPVAPADQSERPASSEKTVHSETDRRPETHPAPGRTPEEAPDKPSAEKKEGGHVASGKGEYKFTNKLIGETSPYLLQHAHNPVNWYPWGDEAFEKARKEDKAIFLSVGYSSCHWCHVMAHESFENEEIAKILNEHYVSIKVDREERPDVDQIYMSAVQLIAGSGGWPMSVFLTPDGKPFWGGTYFPPESMRGRPGFRQILEGIAKAWREDRENIDRSAEEITKAIRSGSRPDVSQFGKGLGVEAKPASITRAPIVAAVRTLRLRFDDAEGGFGGAPKFPPSMSLSLLLREHFKMGDGELLRIVTLTLDKMARGGMYDHLGGGFHRYSTDALWLVPHFEKMLYDNALLSTIYLDAYQVTGDSFYERVAREVLDYVIRDMTHSTGGFYSATDADSEGEEGKFFVWSKKEIASVLGENDLALFCAYYDIKDDGNFSSREEYHAGLNILNVPRAPKVVADEAGLQVDEMERSLSSMRAKLLAVRAKRVAPGLDDKTLTAWNGLMISAFARGFQVVGDPRYREAAERSAGFILKTMTRDGRLLRTYRNNEAKLMGYLNDYAFFIAGLIDLYEATFEIRWLDSALALNAALIEHYWDEADGGFFFTANDHETLIVRSKKFEDSAIPSGNSVAAMNLLRLAKLTDDDDLYKKGERTLLAVMPFVDRFPHAFASVLAAVDFFTEGPKEIAIAGRPDAEDTRALLAEARRHYLPNRVFALVDPTDAKAKELGKKLPLLAGKSLIGGKAACFVCRNYVCKLPVTSPDDVAGALGIEAKK